MQIVAVPLYNKDMAVEAYVFRYHKGNTFLTATKAARLFDGAANNSALETLDLVGLDAFTLGKDIFVPIDHFHLLGDLASQCHQPPEHIILLFESMPKPDDLYVSKIDQLHALGYRFAVSYLDQPEKFSFILRRCSHIFLSQRPENAEKSKRVLDYVKMFYPSITPVAIHIRSEEMMHNLEGLGYRLYESRFFKVPITKNDTGVSPLKANAIRLLNEVQDENFDFADIAKIVQGDPALTISLLKIVNARYHGPSDKIRSIAQAVAMLGQIEVRKWVTTAVSQSLGSDKPNEITRISLVRAKFAENLAPLYGLAHMSQGLFLMGLFSVIDIILEVPMPEALKAVQVSDLVANALVEQSGVFYPVLNMLIDYESAYWSSISRQMILHSISEDDLSGAYIDSLLWYNNLINFDSEELAEKPAEGAESKSAETVQNN